MIQVSDRQLVKTLASNYYVPLELVEEYGANLESVFGPIEDREVSLASLAYDDEGIDEIINQLPNKGIINVRKLFGKSHKKITDNPSVEVKIFKEVLNVLRYSGAMLGYKLPELNLSSERKGLMKLPWHVFVVRPDVNRELNVGHILKNVIRKWDIRYNDPIFVRITTKDGSAINESNWEEHLAKDNLIAVINDHQHGGIGRLLMGAPYALVDPIFCNKMSTDSEMYHKRNGTMLQATWEQQARNSMAVVRDKTAEGDTNIHEQDRLIYEWGQLLLSLNVDFQSSSLPKDKAVCNRGKDLYKYYNTSKYRSFYKESIQLIRDVWPEGELTVEVLWALLTIQAFYVENHKYTPARLKDLRNKIEITLKAYYPDSMYAKTNRNRSTTSAGNTDLNKRTLWGDTNAYRSYLEEIDGDDWRIKIDKGLMMASTIHHMIMSYNKFLLSSGKRGIVDYLAPITTGSGKSIDFKNSYKIYKGNDIITEYNWSDTDKQVDYSTFEEVENV